MASLPPVNNQEVMVNAVSPEKLSTIKFIDESTDSFTDSFENDADTKSKINPIFRLGF